MLTPSILTDKYDAKRSPDEISAYPKGAKRYNKGSKVNERCINDYMLTSARLCAACLIILDKRRKLAKPDEKDMNVFRSTLKEYLSLIETILRKERDTSTYIIRGDAYTVMTMYRVAYLVRKCCRCKIDWYGRRIYAGHFKDYDFGINGLFDRKLYTRFEQMLLKSYKIDPRHVYKMAVIRSSLSKKKNTSR